MLSVPSLKYVNIHPNSQFLVVLTFNLIVVFGINFCLWIDVGFLHYFPTNAYVIIPGPSIK